MFLSERTGYNVDHNVHICGYTLSLQIVVRFHDEMYAEGSGLGRLTRVTPTGS